MWRKVDIKKNAPQQLLLTILNLKLNSEQEKNTVEVSPKIATYYCMDEDNQQNHGSKKYIWHN
jgi:hypothetical protein